MRLWYRTFNQRLRVILLPRCYARPFNICTKILIKAEFLRGSCYLTLTIDSSSCAHSLASSLFVTGRLGMYCHW